MFAAMVVARLALARGGGVAFVVIPTTALVVTRFAFPATAPIVPRIMPATIVLAMPAFALALTASTAIVAEIVANAIVFAMPPFALAPAAPVVASAVQVAAFHFVPANRVAAPNPRQSATRDALTDGPTMTASMAPAHPTAGRSPAVGVAGAAGKQC